MTAANLSPEERLAINTGRWFSQLSATAKHDLLRSVSVHRYEDGAVIVEQGSPHDAWCACASGVLRISSTAVSGKQTTLTYLRPGTWFGGPGLFDGGLSMHDVTSEGDSTVLQIRAQDLEAILMGNSDLCRAVLRLQAQQIRRLYLERDELNHHPVRSRLVKHLLSLAHSHGIPGTPDSGFTRIGLELTQGQLARLVRCSRQQVNTQLKNMERSGLIRIERQGLVICDTAALSANAA